jgi:hypothetical protein
MEKHINRKAIIAFLFATIMVIAGFAGLIYYNPQNNSKTSNANIINGIADEYHLIKTNKMHESKMNIKSNNDIKALKMVETFYNGLNSKGYILSPYVNNAIKSSLFIIFSNNDRSLIIVPIKSNILKSTEIFNINNMLNNKSNKSLCSTITPDTAHLLCYSFYAEFNSNLNIRGAAFSFDNENALRLTTYLASGTAISGIIGKLIGRLAGTVASSVLDTLSDVLLYAFAAGVITGSIIGLVNAYGGFVGVYMGYNTGWFNIPYPIFSYNPVPGSYIELTNCQPVNM